MPSCAGAASSSSADPAARAQDVPITDASANSDDGGGDSKKSRTINGLSVCVLDDGCDEALDAKEDELNDGNDEQHVGPPGLDRRPFTVPAEGKVVTEQRVWATRSGEELNLADIAKARIKELEHMRDHRVFEVVKLADAWNVKKVKPSGCRTGRETVSSLDLLRWRLRTTCATTCTRELHQWRPLA